MTSLFQEPSPVRWSAIPCAAAFPSAASARNKSSPRWKRRARAWVYETGVSPTRRLKTFSSRSVDEHVHQSHDRSSDVPADRIASPHRGRAETNTERAAGVSTAPRLHPTNPVVNVHTSLLVPFSGFQGAFSAPIPQKKFFRYF